MTDKQRPQVVVAGLLAREGRYLLAKEMLENGEPMWLIPGGKVEFGESLEEAVKREILEELGVSATVKRLITHHEAIHTKYDYHTVIFFFELEADGEPKPSATEILETRFMTVDEMDREPLVFSARWLLDKHLR